MKNDQPGRIGKSENENLDIQKIKKILPGLDQYGTYSKDDINEFLAMSNPEHYSNNIWIFIFTTILFIVTWISLSRK